MNAMKTTLAALGLVVAASPSLAQNVNANNLVNVNISDIAVDLADLIDVNVEDILLLAQVQVPIGIAATVCDVNANILAQQARNGGATCDAETASEAFAEAVARQI